MITTLLSLFHDNNNRTGVICTGVIMWGTVSPRNVRGRRAADELDGRDMMMDMMDGLDGGVVWFD